jgi:hypothetical protein
MAERREIDLRAAINAISDVVQNRPRPLRDMDQIYMDSRMTLLYRKVCNAASVSEWTDGTNSIRSIARPAFRQQHATDDLFAHLL